MFQIDTRFHSARIPGGWFWDFLGSAIAPHKRRILVPIFAAFVAR